MVNRAMSDKIASGEAIDISELPQTSDGDYDLTGRFIDGVDYCDSRTEQWVWSIGRSHETGQILASFTGKFYQNPDYECLWLR